MSTCWTSTLFEGVDNCDTQQTEIATAQRKAAKGESHLFEEMVMNVILSLVSPPPLALPPVSPRFSVSRTKLTGNRPSNGVLEGIADGSGLRNGGGGILAICASSC